MFYNSKNNINITFCGMMGSGKSTIGKKFAKIINFGFIDTDILIEERSGKPINDIFKNDGEAYFRKLENVIVTEILEKKNYVISLGGGSITNKNIRNIIKKNSFNIYLEVNINILIKRLFFSKNRPLILNKDIKNELKKLLNKREIFYKSADLIIKNEKNISYTINELKKKLKLNG